MQDEAIRALFASPPQSFSSGSLLLFACYYFLLAALTYGITAPAGLFAPSMLVGSLKTSQYVP